MNNSVANHKQPGYAIVAEFSGISATPDGFAVTTAGGSWPVTSFQPTCNPLWTATDATIAAGAFSIRLLRGSRLPGIGVPRGGGQVPQDFAAFFAPPSSHSLLLTEGTL